jgi:hypothetical protein
MSSSTRLRHNYFMFSYVYKGLDAPRYSSLLAPTAALCKRDNRHTACSPTHHRQTLKIVLRISALFPASSRGRGCTRLSAEYVTMRHTGKSHFAFFESFTKFTLFFHSYFCVNALRPKSQCRHFYKLESSCISP